MITVTVTRSGGFAGLTHTWRIELDAADWDDLRTALSSAPPTDPLSRDRFVYRVEAVRFSVRVPESALDERSRALLGQPRGEQPQDTGDRS